MVSGGCGDCGDFIPESLGVTVAQLMRIADGYSAANAATVPDGDARGKMLVIAMRLMIVTVTMVKLMVLHLMLK